MILSKSDIRREISRLRREYLPSAEELAAMFARLESLPEFREAGTVLMYHPLPDEIDLRILIDRWYGRKTIVLPLVEGGSLRLKQYEPSKMVEGYRGILEPSSEAPDVTAEAIDFAIIPGVAFDRECRRMGRGKGFYDRTLPELNCPKTALAFDFQIVPLVPTDIWDIPLDIIITASETITCPRRSASHP